VGCCGYGNKPLDSLKSRELLASEEGICAMELVICEQ
jgi:hypothetical protein